MTVSTIEEKLPAKLAVIDVPSSKALQRKIAAVVPTTILGLGVTLTVLWSAALVFLVVWLV